MDTPLVEYRGQHSDHDDLMDLPIQRFTSLEELEFDTDAPKRYIITDKRYSLPLDMVYYPRPDSDRLLVGLHGAEGRSTANLPKFQFVRSFTRRSESLLFIADSTLLQGEKINIGWYAGNQNTPLARLAADAVIHAGKATNVKETILIGHSAGGFGAVYIGSMVPNSRAISVNGQTVVERYQPWTVRNLREFAFPECETIEEMMSKYQERLDLRVALNNRVATSTFTHFANRSDDASFSESMPHFPLLRDHFGLPEEGGITEHGDALVACDWHLEGISGHAMPGTAIPFLTLVLDEGESSVPIHHTVDPRWHRASRPDSVS